MSEDRVRRFAMLILSAAALLTVSPPVQAQSKPPNIVMIISDDHGAADYGFLGHPQIKTPNLDRLASQSQVFERGYVTSSLCCPSLASILTGMYPHQNKITSNDPPFKRKAGVAPAKDPDYLRGRQWYADQMQRLPSLVRLLSKRGYLSFQTGKWWHGDHTTAGFTHGMSKGDPKNQGRHGDAGLTIGRKSMEPVYEFMKDAQSAGKPFVVWYAPMLPHTPHDAPDKYVVPYKDKAPSLAVAKYWANVTWFDDTCGQLLDHLEKSGLAENTIVIYVADNGWIQDAKIGQSVRSKRTQYDAGHRTPIMIRWPGKVEPARSKTPVSSIDIAPTLLHAVGLDVPKEMTGINLLDAAAVASRPSIFGECFTHDANSLEDPAANLNWRWAVEGPWRLIVPNPALEPKSVIELYRVDDDPEERTNLADREPERVRAMRQRLDAWWPGR